MMATCPLYQIKTIAILNIKPPSVSEMVGRLEKEGYVETKHYKGARLTEEGLKQTLTS